MNVRFPMDRPLLAAAVLTFAIAGFAKAATIDSLVLISQSGGQYDYGIQLAPNHGLVLVPGDQVILTGLSGVTGASILPGLNICFSSATANPTSVAFVDTSSPCVFDPVATGVTIGDLRVLSAVLTTGPVNYQIQTGNEGTLSGTVPGPAAVPEPHARSLAAGGILALLILIRTRH
jgi:hypothetical protein